MISDTMDISPFFPAKRLRSTENVTEQPFATRARTVSSSQQSEYERCNPCAEPVAELPATSTDEEVTLLPKYKKDRVVGRKYRTSNNIEFIYIGGECQYQCMHCEKTYQGSCSLANHYKAHDEYETRLRKHAYRNTRYPGFLLPFGAKDWDDPAARQTIHAYLQSQGWECDLPAKLTGRTKLFVRHIACKSFGTPQLSGIQTGQGIGCRCRGKQQSSRYIGVSLNKVKKGRKQVPRPWKSYICSEGQTISIGFFKTEVEAAEAYDKKARECGAKEDEVNFPISDEAEQRAIEDRKQQIMRDELERESRMKKSKFKGVRYNPDTYKWEVHIHNKRTHNDCRTEEEAARAWDTEARKDKSRSESTLNFPDVERLENETLKTEVKQVQGYPPRDIPSSTGDLVIGTIYHAGDGKRYKWTDSGWQSAAAFCKCHGCQGKAVTAHAMGRSTEFCIACSKTHDQEWYQSYAKTKLCPVCKDRQIDHQKYGGDSPGRHCLTCAKIHNPAWFKLYMSHFLCECGQSQRLNKKYGGIKPNYCVRCSKTRQPELYKAYKAECACHDCGVGKPTQMAGGRHTNFCFVCAKTKDPTWYEAYRDENACRAPDCQNIRCTELYGEMSTLHCINCSKTLNPTWYEAYERKRICSFCKTNKNNTQVFDGERAGSCIPCAEKHNPRWFEAYRSHRACRKCGVQQWPTAAYNDITTRFCISCAKTCHIEWYQAMRADTICQKCGVNQREMQHKFQDRLTKYCITCARTHDQEWANSYDHAHKCIVCGISRRAWSKCGGRITQCCIKCSKTHDPEWEASYRETVACQHPECMISVNPAYKPFCAHHFLENLGENDPRRSYLEVHFKTERLHYELFIKQSLTKAQTTLSKSGPFPHQQSSLCDRPGYYEPECLKDIGRREDNACMVASVRCVEATFGAQHYKEVEIFGNDPIEVAQVDGEKVRCLLEENYAYLHFHQEDMWNTHEKQLRGQTQYWFTFRQQCHVHISKHGGGHLYLPKEAPLRSKEDIQQWLKSSGPYEEGTVVWI